MVVRYVISSQLCEIWISLGAFIFYCYNCDTLANAMSMNPFVHYLFSLTAMRAFNGGGLSADM